MVFGVGVTDVLTISKLAWNVYKSCKESSDDFKRVSTEVASLHVILKETEEFLNEDNGLSETRQERLGILMETSSDILNDLKRQLSSYESLGTHSQRTWDRLRWGLEDIADVRSRLISVNTTLAAFNSSLTTSSQSRIEKKLEKFVAEVRAGFREGSVVSSHHRQGLDDSNSWNELQRELEDVGLSAGMITEHQQYIKSWFKDAIASGLLDEVHSSSARSGHDCGDDGNDISKSRRGRTTHPSSVTTEVNPASFTSSGPISPQTTLVNESDSNGSDESLAKPRMLRTRTTPQDIDALLSHDDPPFPELPPPSRSDTSASHSPAALLRKKSIPSMILFRLFQNGTKLIEAASDGSLERVARLLSLGADVNVRDKWGWTALSMAAYGGHDKIARLLLACGAEIEIVDVDGDSPLDLATNRGHADVVIAIEEERANRVVRGMPESYMAGAGKLRKSISGVAFAKSQDGTRTKTSLATAMETGDLTPLPMRDPDAVRPVPRNDTTSIDPFEQKNKITGLIASRSAPEETETFGPIKPPLRRAETRDISPFMRSSTREFGPLKKRPTFKTRDER